MENEKEQVVVVEKPKDFVKSPFSSDFTKNFDSQKEIEKQSEVYHRPLQTQNLEEPKKTEIKQEKVIKKLPKAVIETPNYDFIEVKDTGLKVDQKVKEKRKFRLKLVSIVYCLIFAMCGGWVIGNAIELSKTNYAISELQYLIKIEQLDGFQEVENGDNIITSVVDIEPQPFAEPSTIQPQTNWFDKFCTWLKNILGG